MESLKALSETSRLEEAAAILLQRRKARRNLIEFARATMPDYIPGWHHEYMDRAISRMVDGDLRRLIDRVSDLRSITIDAVMSRAPRSIGPQALAVEGVALMERHRINQLPVVDADDRVVGALNMHDLFAAGVV